MTTIQILHSPSLALARNRPCIDVDMSSKRRHVSLDGKMTGNLDLSIQPVRGSPLHASLKYDQYDTLSKSLPLDDTRIQSNDSAMTHNRRVSNNASSSTSEHPAGTISGTYAPDSHALGDVEMGHSDEECEHISNDEGSAELDLEKSSGKRKKGQRFYCLDFPPCKLSFTRSEHLARHIRKHTGERPFQCHCSRRFSRLDNLRQHAQTVHVNEDIPVDSLAASSARFQRQLRPDRVVRPAVTRARTTNVTGSLTQSSARGHTRNWSASSAIPSSSISAYQQDDTFVRHRPSLSINTDDASGNMGAFGSDGPRLPLVFHGPSHSADFGRNSAATPPGHTTFYRDESEGFSTPTSATYSTEQNSPIYGSAIASPVSSAARSSGKWDGRGHFRTFSVPSTAGEQNSPRVSTFFPVQPSSHISPSYSIKLPDRTCPAAEHSNAPLPHGKASELGSHQLMAGTAHLQPEPRRQTWHPTAAFNRQFPSSSQTQPTIYESKPLGAPPSEDHQTPPRLYHRSHHVSLPPPSALQSCRSVPSDIQLPGIESFDQISQLSMHRTSRSSSNLARQPSHINSSSQPTSPLTDSSHRMPGSHTSWDLSLHQNLTKLNLVNASSPAQTERSQSQSHSLPLVGHPSETLRETTGSSVCLPREPQPDRSPMASNGESKAADQEPPVNRKRQGWYAGPPLKTLSASTTAILSSNDQSFPASTSPSLHSITERTDIPNTSHNGSIEVSSGAQELESYKTKQETQVYEPLSDATHSYRHANDGVSKSSVEHSSQDVDRGPKMTSLDVLVAAATGDRFGPSISTSGTSHS